MGMAPFLTKLGDASTQSTSINGEFIEYQWRVPLVVCFVRERTLLECVLCVSRVFSALTVCFWAIICFHGVRRVFSMVARLVR